MVVKRDMSQAMRLGLRTANCAAGHTAKCGSNSASTLHGSNQERCMCEWVILPEAVLGS